MTPRTRDRISTVMGSASGFSREGMVTSFPRSFATTGMASPKKLPVMMPKMAVVTPHSSTRRTMFFVPPVRRNFFCTIRERMMNTRP